MDNPSSAVPQSALAEAPSKQVGVDIGGTFTDVVLLDELTGRLSIEKVLTTPAEPAKGVLTGVDKVLSSGRTSAQSVSSILHATTLASNAIIERRGSKTAFITTRGFRDVVEIRDEGRYDLYDLFLELPKPLVPRRLRWEIDERIDASGRVLRQLDEAEARLLGSRLRQEGVEAVAICLLHSYRNPVHERQLAAILRSELPDVEVSISSEVIPEIREFQRSSTTIANAYVQKKLRQYLAELATSFESDGFGGKLFVMMSGGGLCTVEAATHFPVRLIESGPAAGALVAALLGKLAGHRNLLSFDMGGTTAKACLIEDGEPHRTDDFEVDRVWRFKKGSGLPIKAPVIELVEIGAGGGSIAVVDSLGRLRVGPSSAGADPGPVCYRRGGTLPTVTDADLVLGFLDVDYFLGGTMALDLDAARHSIEKHVARPLGLDIVQAAWGIHRLVNESMASAARMAASERGKSAANFPLFAFGGAGPVHADGVARILRVPAYVVPAGAGVGSALGLLCAPLSFDFVNSWVLRLDRTDWARVRALYGEMESAGARILGEARVPRDKMRIVRSADMRFVGQGHEINVLLPEGQLHEGLAGEIAARFQETYQRRYGRTLVQVPVEVTNWRCLVAAPSPNYSGFSFDGAASRDASANAGAPKRYRQAYSSVSGCFVETPVYERYSLRPRWSAMGPAIIEERESTTVVGEKTHISVDEFRNLVVEFRS